MALWNTRFVYLPKWKTKPLSPTSDSGTRSLLSQLIVYREISLKEWMEFKKLAIETSGSDKQIIESSAYKFTRLWPDYQTLHHGAPVDNLDVFGLWEEATVAGENPCGYRENMQSPHRKAQAPFFILITPAQSKKKKKEKSNSLFQHSIEWESHVQTMWLHHCVNTNISHKVSIQKCHCLIWCGENLELPFVLSLERGGSVLLWADAANLGLRWICVVAALLPGWKGGKCAPCCPYTPAVVFSGGIGGAPFPDENEPVK